MFLFQISMFVIIHISITIAYLLQYKRQLRNDIFSRHDKIQEMLEAAKEASYQKIFRDHILVYSSSGFRINKDEITKLQSLYVKSVFVFCGAAITDELNKIYGDLDSICALLVNDFIHRVEQDESAITSIIEDQKKDIENNNG